MRDGFATSASHAGPMILFAQCARYRCACKCRPAWSTLVYNSQINKLNSSPELPLLLLLPEDNFNLYGLREVIGSNFKKCLDIILDRSDEEHLAHDEGLERGVQDLFGLVHSRFLLTKRGQDKMVWCCVAPTSPRE
jgi:hypothetical protein